MKGINLLKRAQTPQILRAKLKKTLNIITFIFIIIFIVVLASLVATNIFLTVKINEGERQVKNAQIKLNALAEVEVTQLAISDKSNALEKIFSQDRNYGTQIDEFARIIPHDALVVELLLEEEGSSLIKITSPKLSTLNEFVASFISSQKQTSKKIFLEDLSIDENSRYRMSVSMGDSK